MIPTPSHDLRLRVQKPAIGAGINWDHPLAPGLVGAWLLQEGGGVWRDYAGRYGANLYTPATSTGLVSLAPSIGMAYPSARFVAASSQVLGPPSAVNVRIVPTPPFTFVASALRTASSNNPAVAMCYTYYGGGTGGGGYGIDIYNNNLRAWVYRPSTFAGAGGSTTLSSNVRYVLGGVFESTSLRRCYVNGKQDGIDTTSVAQPLSLDTLALGCLYRSDNVGKGSNFLDGWIDWAYYWNRALSASEMLWLYQEPFAMFLPTMPRHARMAGTGVRARNFAVMVG